MGTCHSSEADAKDCDGRTALHLAAALGLDDRVTELLELGADVNLRDKKKQTALHYARTGEVARILLESGASVNARDNRGRTPLRQAVIHKRDDVASVLLEFRANVNLCDEDRLTALHCTSSAKMAGILLEKGAHVDARDNKNWTPLHRAAIHGHLDICPELHELPDHPDFTDEIRQKALHLAQSESLAGILLDLNDDLVSVLVEFGADVNLRDGDNRTALHSARSEKVARILLKSGAIVNARDDEDLTPLHLASFNNRDDVVSVLLEFGADVDLRDKDKLTALHFARSGKVARMLLKKGADVDARSGINRTPLYSAVFVDEYDLVSALLESGADVNIRDSNNNLTALHHAKSGKVARILLEKGADVNARDIADRTPLHGAVYYQHDDVVPVLLEFGADVNIRDKFNHPAIHFSGSLNIIRILSEKIVKG